MSDTGGSQVYQHDSPLPFSDSKQLAFLGYVFEEKTGLFKYILPFATPKWFTNATAGAVWDAIKRFYEVGKKVPSAEQLSEWTPLSRDHDLKNRMQSVIAQAVHQKNGYTSFENLKKEVETWMQAKVLQEYGERAAAHFNNEQFAEAARCYQDGYKAFNDVRVSLGNFKYAHNLKELAEGQGKDAVVKFGLSGIDGVLFPNNPKGGLRKGDQTLVMAPSNHGKTSVLITSAIHNVIGGNLVLLLTHQGRDTDIRIKYIRCFLNLVPITLFREILMTPIKGDFFTDAQVKNLHAVATDERKLLMMFNWLREIGKDVNAFLLSMADVTFRYTILQQVMHWLDSRLVYASHHKAFLKVEEVIPVLERAQEECQTKNNNRGFDLCIDDYPGCLQTDMNAKGNYQQRQVMDICYEAFVQTALSHNWHSLVAVQTNREGSKKASGYDGIQFSGKSREIRFLRNEDIAEAWGPITGATNVITVNRSPEAMMNKMVTYFIAKSRSSMTGIAVTCYEDYELAVTHNDDYGWISYSLGHEDQRIITGFLKRNTQKALSIQEVHGMLSGEKGIDVNKVAA